MCIWRSCRLFCNSYIASRSVIRLILDFQRLHFLKTGIRESGGGVRSGSDDKFTVLEFSPSSPPGAFRMRGVESDLFLAMDEKGRLYGEGDRLNNNVLFTEHAQVRKIDRGFR